MVLSRTRAPSDGDHVFSFRGHEKVASPTPALCHLEPESSFLTLPNELIEDIAERLPPADLTCLSLICKRFQLLLRHRAKASLISEDQKRNLLLRLEEELPDWLLCHRCSKLFPWRITQRKPQNRLYSQPMHHSCQRCRECTHDQGFSLCGNDHGGVYFRRETRDLILRYYRRGPEYGLPLSYIEHACCGVHPVTREISINMTFKPKIIDGNLMIWQTDELRVDLRDPAMRNNVYKFRGRVCCHIGPHLPAIVLCQIESIISRLDFDYSSEYEPSPSHECAKTMFCHSCNTDFRVSLEPCSDKTALIQVNAWYNFGGRHEWLMSPDIMRYCPRDLERLYNSNCTHSLRETSPCRVLPKSHTYQNVGRWRWTTQKDGSMKIELPEGPYRNQRHHFKGSPSYQNSVTRLSWIRRSSVLLSGKPGQEGARTCSGRSSLIRSKCEVYGRRQ